MIVVAGEALVDLVPGLDGKHHPRPGGGPFNTARALTRLGVPTAFLGHLSDDVNGSLLADLLASDGTDLSLASFGPETTTSALAEVDADGHAAYRFLVEGTSAPQLTRASIPAELSSRVRALHVGTLGLVLEPMASALTELAQREAGRRLVMLDPNIRTPMLVDEGAYRHRLEKVLGTSTIVKASDADLDWLYPGADRDAAVARIQEAGARLVVVTLGAAGAVGWSGSGRISVRAPRVAVADTIGAGDVFGAGILAWLHDRELLHPKLDLDLAELQSLLEFACLVASLACTRPGAEPPWRSEVASSVAALPGGQAGVGAENPIA